MTAATCALYTRLRDRYFIFGISPIRPFIFHPRVGFNPIIHIKRHFSLIPFAVNQIEPFAQVRITHADWPQTTIDWYILNYAVQK